MDKGKKTYVGLDMGTSSVGWAVTDEFYNLRRAKGKDLWGVRLFEEASTSAERRGYRISRRRRQREVARISLLKEYFAEAIEKVDPGFYHRLEESAFHFEDRSDANKQKYTLFSDKKYTDEDYYKEYPTIFHLRKRLLTSSEAVDVRLVYLALANMFKHRGHFLNTTLSTEEENGDITEPYAAFCEKAEMFTIDFPKGDDNAKKLEDSLSTKGLSRSRIAEKTIELLGFTKKNKEAVELIKLMCGCTGKLRTIYGEEIIDEEHKAQSLCFRDSTYEQHEQEALELLGDEYFELIELTKEIHDIGLLANVMKGREHLTLSRVDAYEKHKEDLQLLKSVLRKYDQDAYNKMFRIMEDGNYSAYIGSVNSDHCHDGGKQRRNGGSGRAREDLYKSVKQILTKCPPEDPNVQRILAEIENEQFLPKQLTASNGVIPNQVYVREMKAILRNAETYLSFLKEKNDAGLTVSEQIVQIFSFHIPYYVGPLGDSGDNIWAVKREGGRILPWNIEQKINMAETAEKFISRMVRHCTYMNGELTLPKNSLLYEKYMVLNELNNLKVYGEPISVELKQAIYTNLFETGKKVSVKGILSYLQKEAIAKKEDTVDCLSGIDHQGFKASLASLGKAKAVLGKGCLSDDEKAMMEQIIFWKTVYGNEKKLLVNRIQETYKDRLNDSELKRILGYKFEGWGNLSREFLEIEGESKKDGMKRSIIQTLWETNDNLMQILSSEYTFKDEIEKKIQCAEKPLAEWAIEDLDGMYLSAPVKRMVWQTMKILGELKEVTKAEPDRIFVEMAREEGEKGVRKDSRKKKLLDLYTSLKKEGKEWRDEIEGKTEADFRIKKLYLYYLQMGKDMYTGKKIDLHDLFADNKYDIDHIYPRHFVKDDSIENNLVLVNKQDNAHKSDTYPLEVEVQKKQAAFWKMLVEKEFITKEKYQRLVRRTVFTEQEKADFISRQLVETRQGTKAITQIIKQAFPKTTVVFSKAGEVSSFRKKIDWVKVRSVNDLHHAKDAYLNIVVGNTYYVKFNNNPLNYVREAAKSPVKDEYKYHMDKIFNFTVKRGAEVAWKVSKDEPGSIDIVDKVMGKTSPLITKRSYVVNAGITGKETIWSAEKAKEEGYLPVKSKDTPLADVTKYGGRTSINNMCYCLVEYKVKGKRVLSLESLPVYLGPMEELSDERITEYLQSVLEVEHKGKAVTDIIVKLKPIRIRSRIKLDGHYYYLAGKTGDQICLENGVSLFLEREMEKYVQKIEKAYNSDFYDEKDRNKQLIISASKNAELWNIFNNKLNSQAYDKKRNSLKAIMTEGGDQFISLGVEEQVHVLLQILQSFQLACLTSDASKVGGSKRSGYCRGSKKITDAKEAILIQQSITGLYTHEIDLLSL